MFYGTYDDISFSQYGTSLCFYYIFSESFNNGLVFKIDALYFITVVFGGGKKGCGNIQSGM